MKQPSSEVQTQVNNILETLKNFGRSDADSEDIGDHLLKVMVGGEYDVDFFDFIEMLDDVENKLIDARADQEG